MKKKIIAATLAAGMFTLVACNADKEDADVVVTSKVGDITKEDFYNVLKKRSGEQVLQEMVSVKVLEDKYEVDDKKIDEQVDDAKDQLGENFEMWLMQEGYGDEETFRDFIYTNLLYEEAIYEDVEISDEDVKTQYDRMKTEIEARHILVEDEDLANEIKEKLDEGEDFADLAEEHSTDTGSAEQGGDLGYFSAGKMVKEFEDAAYNLEVDKISDPVKSEHGYHIIEVTDKREVEDDIGSFEENEVQIQAEMKQKIVDPNEAQEKIYNLLDDADIDVQIEDFKDMFKQDA